MMMYGAIRVGLRVLWSVASLLTRAIGQVKQADKNRVIKPKNPPNPPQKSKEGSSTKKSAPQARGVEKRVPPASKATKASRARSRISHPVNNDPATETIQICSSPPPTIESNRPNTNLPIENVVVDGNGAISTPSRRTPLGSKSRARELINRLKTSWRASQLASSSASAPASTLINYSSSPSNLTFRGS